MFGTHLPKSTWSEWGIDLSYQEASDIRSLSQCPLILSNLDKLPASRSTLIAAWQLASTRPKVFQRSIEDGTISPVVLRSTVRQLKHFGKPARKPLHIVSDTKYGKVQGTLLHGDCLALLKTLKPESVNCCVTSPPYFQMRNYEVAGQIGMESTPEEYIAKLVAVFKEVHRVLTPDGTVWINIGDTYAGSGKSHEGDGTNCIRPKEHSNLQGNPEFNRNRPSRDQIRRPDKSGIYFGPDIKPKDLVGIPWMLAFALRADGWYLRSEIIWSKPSVMPESVKDRPTRNHEQILLLTKSAKYFYDADAAAEPRSSKLHVHASGNPDRNDNNRCDAMWGNRETKNRRSVWSMNPGSYDGAHFATFPPELPELCLKAGCPPGGTVLDCFAGSGTTLLVAAQNGRSYIGIELNPEYVEMTRKRLKALAQQKA
jgi:DNA modification methylase